MDKSEQVRSLYDERWSGYPDDYLLLSQKDRDRNYVLPGDPIQNQILRAVLALDWIRGHCSKTWGRILEVACGRGALSCYLTKLGYNAAGFDISSVGIDTARALAKELNISPDIFTISDFSYFDQVPTESLDVITAFGILRYVSDADREYFYRNAERVLKPGGYLLVTNTNLLFHPFALNDHSIKFWRSLIEGLSDISERLPFNIMDVFKSLSLPERTYAPHSVSQKVSTHEENPLAYPEKVRRYGLRVEKILYPDCHLLPPFMEAMVDQDLLKSVKAEVLLSRSEDWRGMFMDYEFLACVVK
jgi:SAM-dependent methyltransferase